MKTLSLLVKPAAGLCNMRCGYCFYRAASELRDNRIMAPETADELISKIAAARPSALSVAFQGGEPTLAGLDFFKDFVRKMKEAVPCPVGYSLQTNGLLIDGAWAAFLKENAFLVGVSLDGDRRTNDRYRVDNHGESVLPRVLEAVSALKKHGVDFNVLSVIDDENAKDIDATWKYFKKHGFGFLQFIPYVDEGGGPKLTPEAYETFLKRSFDLWYEDLTRGEYISVRHIDNYVGILMGRQPESCAMRGLCGGYFTMEANGDIYPCDFYCKEEYKIGSVFDDEPFTQNEKQRRFIEDSLTIRETCKSCEYYALCRGGCRRDRTDGLTKNRYCAAYRGFFGYAADRMKRAAEAFGYGE
ncbi:MAG: SPASM domain-containing protein [Clostridia bacterium]|nr:SPASM domain-containing protein [Clostridia bacterium]